MKLKQYIDIYNGYPFNSSDMHSNNEGYPVIKIKELKNNSVVFTDDTQFVPINDIYSSYIVNKGDILIALTGNPPSKPNKDALVGRVSKYKFDSKSYLNQRVCKIKSKTELLSNDYLFYYLSNDKMLIEISNKCTGSANQANISSNDILNLNIDLPPLPSQQHIVESSPSIMVIIEILYFSCLYYFI